MPAACEQADHRRAEVRPRRAAHSASPHALRGDQVDVNVDDRTENFDRSQLLAITPSARRELNLWTARASAGVSIRSGNTGETTLSGELHLGREAKRKRLGITYNGAYGSLNNKKNTNNHRGHTTFDYFLMRDVFLTPANFEVFSDEFQNISYRLTPSASAGSCLLRRPKVEWFARLRGGDKTPDMDDFRITAGLAVEYRERRRQACRRRPAPDAGSRPKAESQTVAEEPR